MLNDMSIPFVFALQMGAYMYCFTEFIFKHRLVENAYWILMSYFLNNSLSLSRVLFLLEVIISLCTITW